MQEEFSIGIQLNGQLHFSDVVHMCSQDAVESPYRSTNENLLFVDGHIQLDIPVKAEGVTIQASFITSFVNYNIIRYSMYEVNQLSAVVD